MAMTRIQGAGGTAIFMALLCLLSGDRAQAASPTLDHLYPAGAGPGSTNLVRLSGKADPWPPQVWVSGGSLQVTTTTNKNELEVVVAADAEPGPRLVRLFNDEGASELRPFIVGNGRELTEAEPNNHFAAPMAVGDLPVTVNGRLEKSGDVDSYAVHVPAGRRLRATLVSHLLMSKLDGVLRVVTTNGHQLAWNHDSATIDPEVECLAESDSVVVVQVFGFPFPATADIRLTGGEGAFYRLRLGVYEAEPTPSPGDPGELSLPVSRRDCLAESGARHRHSLKLVKGEWISAAVAAASLGSPVDAWLAVENSEGRELARNDDADGSSDPALDWQVPEDGVFQFVVGSLTRNAGPDHRYRLTIERSAPDWRAGLVNSSLTAKPGSTNELRVTFARLRGLTNELQVLANNLPEGVTVEPVAAPAKGGELKLSVVVSATAAAWRGPVEVVCRDATTGHERIVPFRLTGTEVNNGVPGGYRVLLADQVDHFWLTVLPAEPEKPAE
ncbi:MAG TPA: hypothetical protein DCY13_03975 [Verrucomicrobiales bacterium]|nr:hypothetical protein [Verrucomicrobiales bacterium]